MAKVTYTSPLVTNTQAGWESWVNELYDALVACGLVQTADTGQLAMPTAAPLPGNNVQNQYWVFRFDDSLAASAPIYIRFDVYRSTASSPQIKITYGTGSNGAGGITGEIHNAVAGPGNNTPVSGAHPTFVNHDEGFFGLVFKTEALAANGWGFVTICRTCAPDTTPTGEGVVSFMRYDATNFRVHSHVFGGGSWADTSKAWCMVPYSVSSSPLPGANTELYKVYARFPDVRLVPQVAVALTSELAVGVQTGPTEIVDGVSRNFIGSGLAGRNFAINGANNQHAVIKWD